MKNLKMYQLKNSDGTFARRDNGEKIYIFGRDYIYALANAENEYGKCYFDGHKSIILK